MTWVKLDEHMPENAKVLEAGPLAAWMHVCGIAYCNRHLTDGFVPEIVAPRLMDHAEYGEGVDDLTGRLTEVGLWEWDADRLGWWIHDYHDYQPSAAEEKAKRKAKQEAGRLGGQRSAEVRAQRAGTAQPPASKQPEAPASNGVEARTEPSRSVPTRTDPQEEEISLRGFDEFWRVYPRKVEKRAAQKRWRILLDEGVDPDVLYLAAENYAAECERRRTGLEYVKHAATFLSKNRPWEDWLERPSLQLVSGDDYEAMTPAQRELQVYRQMRGRA